jgi:hypothetical protein
VNYANAWTWVRFRANGTTISARIWDESLAEPGSWGISATDAAIATGSVGVAAIVGVDASCEIDLFAAATNGDTATATVPRSSETWAKEPDAILDTVVEVRGLHRNTGAAASFYFSRRGRNLGDSDVIGRADIAASLKTIRLPGKNIAAAALFQEGGGGGEAGGGQIVIANNLGSHDSMLDYTFAGQKAIARVGELSQPLRASEPVWAGTMSGEPVFSPDQISIDVSSEPAWLDQPVAGKIYVGIPTGVKLLTGSGNISLPHNAAHAATKFLVALRVYLPSGGIAGSSYNTLALKQGTYTQLWLALNQASHATAPNNLYISANSSTGGNIIVHTIGALTTGAWNDIIVAVRGGVGWWVSINGTITTGTTSANPANTTNAMSVSGGNNLIYCDLRWYDYLEQEDALARFAQRLEPDVQCYGMWRCDDNTGSTVTDYSSLAGHGTMAGTVNVDWRWEPTDLGDSGLAGQAMPVQFGTVRGVEATLIDAARSRYRYSDGIDNSGLTTAVRAQGVVLTVTTDYTEPSTGVIDFVNPPAQPVTIDRTASSYGTFGNELRQLLNNRTGGTEHTQWWSESIDAAAVALPFAQPGLHYDETPEAAQILGAMVKQTGGHLLVDAGGRLAVSSLWPPLNPGPYGLESLLEFGGYKCGVTLDPSITCSGSFSVACWCKLHSQSRYGTDGLYSFNTYLIARTRFALGLGPAGWTFGVSNGSWTTISSGVGTDPPMGAWHYVLATYDATAHTMKIWVAKLGASALTLVASTTGLGAVYTEALSPIVVAATGDAGGQFFGSVAYAQLFNVAKTNSDVTADLTARPPTNRSGLVAYVAMTDGSGQYVTDTVSASRIGRISGARWCPQFVYDLRTYGQAKLANYRRLRPAWRVQARYKTNYRPLTGAEFNASVSQADRAALAAPYKVAYGGKDQRSLHADSRDVPIDTPLSQEIDASFLAKTVADRLSSARATSDLDAAHQEILTMEPGSEVHVYHPRFVLSAGKAFRVLRIPAALEGYTGALGMWG